MTNHPLALALAAILCMVVVSWLLSIVRNDVSFVDSLWSLFFLIAATVFVLNVESLSTKGQLVFFLVAAWGVVELFPLGFLVVGRSVQKVKRMSQHCH